MKYLVTGASGLIGLHLVTFLREQGHDVSAVSRSVTPLADAGIQMVSVSVDDQGAVEQLVRDLKPDTIVHLAAQTLPGVSWEEPAATFSTNVNGTMNLLTAVKKHAPSARFVMISSSSVYAPSKDGLPIAEDGALAGSSPYALSKLAAEKASLLYGEHHGMDVVCVRPFFIIGPGKKGDVSSDFARRIVAVERGEMERITVGSLDVTRDFLDVRDAVRGIALIAEKGAKGSVYNLSSGEGVSIRELLDTLKAMSVSEIVEVVDPSLIRPIEEPVKVGSPARLVELGWERTIMFEESMRMILTYWREKA